MRALTETETTHAALVAGQQKGSLPVAAPMELGCAVDKSLQLEVVGVKKKANERVHVIHFSVSGDNSTGE